ncbi:glycine--tRNA ligase-like [Condylostylus longicornis]|uniref:glycine--tRNA ligase-like n=1 Tax=Condylostylus longicornis TaxID=2530218 RepID=UPI00244DEA2B|nr:glycine--tRNA ligase-like [Condylostylus longicornis]
MSFLKISKLLQFPKGTSCRLMRFLVHILHCPAISPFHTATRLSMVQTGEMQTRLDECRAKVAFQGEKVRTLKKSGVPQSEVTSEVEALLLLKHELADVERQVEELKPLYCRCRTQLENLAKRRSFFFPAFEIYGGTAGLFDWGPPGCAIKAEVESLWRRHFVLYEDMLEVSGTCLTPHNVLKTSGHVDRFCDLMTSDTKTGDCYRADKLLEDFIDAKLADSKGISKETQKLELIRRQADSFSTSEMYELFQKLGVQSPLGNALSEPFPFNLMFKTRIGPKEDLTSETTTAYLRPETAQGIFVNFRRLLEYNAGRMPFAAAQLGLGFRNEIAPRNGLLRVREFQMAEIEHFVDPKDKSHSKFSDVAELKLPLFPKKNQLSDGKIIRNITIREAVESQMINNETLGYFMARTFLFLTNCGIQECGLRFRQHLDTEMAHYASDCWDAEIETSYGWVECVGHADRAAYDLTHHTKATKTPLVASKRYEEPRLLKSVEMVANRALLGPAFKKDQTLVLESLEEKSDEEKLLIENDLTTSGSYVLQVCNGDKFTITRPMVKFETVEKKVSEETFVPGVIEPSFGIGRIIYCILEHTFRSRGIEDQEERCFLSLPIVIAPIKCSVLSISTDARFNPIMQTIKGDMVKLGVSSKLDSSGASIGKRYARTDEIGIPFGITVDFQSLKDGTVTLRERDSMQQLRVAVRVVGWVIIQ